MIEEDARRQHQAALYAMQAAQRGTAHLMFPALRSA
jgi:hypothetical protein